MWTFEIKHHEIAGSSYIVTAGSRVSPLNEADARAVAVQKARSLGYVGAVSILARPA